MDMRTYMLKANNWKHNETELIWSEVHQKAINTLRPEKKKFIQKFIHNRLPTNYRQRKYLLQATFLQCLQYRN
jgi:hypothetical protein